MSRFWNLPVNWRKSYEVSLDFRTEILKSRSGKEQRRALRQTPRKTIEYLVTCTKERYRILAEHMAKGQGATFDVGDLSLAVTAPDGAPLSGDRIAVESVPFWATVGAMIVLTSGKQIALYTIASIEGSYLVFTGVLAEVWPAGTKVSPALSAYANESLSGRVHTENAVELAVEFKVNPGTDPVETPPAASTTFNGREVFTKKPNYGDAVTLGFVSGREQVDYGQGRIANYLPVKFPMETYKATYLGRDRADIDGIRQFFLRMKGQQGEFYMPTWMADIQPKQALVSSQTTLVVAGTDFANAYAGDTVHKALALYRTNGTVLYRQVSSVAVSGSDSLITCVGTWGSAIALTDIKMVSWMPVWRLASDGLTLEYVTDDVAQTVLAMTTLEDLTGD